jgi:hypothetical protein
LELRLSGRPALAASVSISHAARAQVDQLKCYPEVAGQKAVVLTQEAHRPDPGVHPSSA